MPEVVDQTGDPEVLGKLQPAAGWCSVNRCFHHRVYLLKRQPNFLLLLAQLFHPLINQHFGFGFLLPDIRYPDPDISHYTGVLSPHIPDEFARKTFMLCKLSVLKEEIRCGWT